LHIRISQYYFANSFIFSAIADTKPFRVKEFFLRQLDKRPWNKNTNAAAEHNP